MTDTSLSSQILHLSLGCFSVQLVYMEDAKTGIVQFPSLPQNNKKY